MSCRSHPENAGDYNSTGRENLIHIYAKEGDSYRDAFSTTSVTFHELGHASHQQQNTMKPNIKKVKESWATGISYAYMKSLDPYYFSYNYKTETRLTYTSLVKSLMCQGVTLNDIQSALQNAGSWDSWRDNIKSKGIIPNNITDLIFAYPNRFEFDLKQPVETVRGDNTIFSEQLVWLWLKGEVNGVPSLFKVADVDVLEWILPDNDGRIVYSDKFTAGILFNQDRVWDVPVKKRIQAKVKYLNGVQELCDFSINVRGANILSIPELTDTYVPFTVSIPISRFNDPEVYLSECKVFPDGTVSNFDPEMDREAVITFNSPGEKTIKIKIKYLLNSTIERTVEYERKVRVREMDDKNSFTLSQNIVYPLKQDEWYTAFYARQADGKSISIVKVDMRHMKYFFEYNYDTTHWAFDKRYQSISFKIPVWNTVPIDYILGIHYRIFGETKIRYAEVYLSNNHLYN